MTLPEQTIQECLTARKNCVLFDHPNRGVIEVQGPDRTQFLHNILTNDIKALAPGKGAPACLLNAQAKLIANVNVLCFDEFVWLALDYTLKDKLLESLKKMVIMEQVELVDRSDEFKLISVHGPKAKEPVETVLKKDLPPTLLSHMTVTVGSVLVTCIRINLTGETGYGLLASKDNALQIRGMLEEMGAILGLRTIQLSTLETLRIEAGIPRYGIDFDESHIPLEARLDTAISFTKGCFPGQEILARLDSRGGVSKKLMGLVLKGETVPRKNDRILRNGKEVGQITSGVSHPS